MKTLLDTTADAALVERMAARDERALGELYDRHSRLLFGLTLRILRDRAEAEEVLHEAFMAAWTRAATYNRALGSPVAWLVSIARNRSIDRLRSARLRAAMAEPPADLHGGESPESTASLGEQQREVARALATLQPEQRRLIEEAFFQGFTHSELAERFQLPLGTVKTRIRSGMLALRDELSRAFIES
jgi:RNA polymerase sigma-70 factor, ECF subfamily